jgi:S-adenosylmethionine:tRNA ribosyltransferase-isomerase
MSLRTADYNYQLPPELIASYPAERRDESRLMLLDRNQGKITHLRFRDLPDLLRPEELVVLNNTEVIPARIRFPDRNAEMLLLEQIDALTWRCMVRPGKLFSLGRTFSVYGYVGNVTQIDGEGYRVIRFDRSIELTEIGEIPLPPYLSRLPEAIDRERYQTVFASQKGAIAAPTAGLHFTPELLNLIPHEFVTLHVGAGTFLPVKVANITDHQLHREHFKLTAAAATKIQEAKEVLAVGTTTVRTLEALMQQANEIKAGEGSTNIFIHPPFQFRRVNSLLTNFHLPKSTLLMLVAALAGREFILEAYQEAVRERYRFFSYGDCMLIR